MLRTYVAAALLFVLVAAAPASAAPSSERYDEAFRRYSKRFFSAAFDWRLFKAQGMTESGLRDVTSPAGARGIMQILPSTYEDAKRRNRDLGDIEHPEWNIAAGIWYARQQWDYFYDIVDKAFRREFMLGSYNAGRSTVVRAQRVAQAQKLDHTNWVHIINIAPKVPGWNYRETINYIFRVYNNLNRLDRRGKLRAD